MEIKSQEKPVKPFFFYGVIVRAQIFRKNTRKILRFVDRETNLRTHRKLPPERLRVRGSGKNTQPA